MKVIELLKSKEWSGKVIDCVLRFALSFALAGAQVFGGYAPLALGMIGASGAGLRGVSALIGASAGAVLFLPFSHALRTFAAGVLIFTANNAFFDLKLYKKRAFLPLLCAGMMFSVEFVYVLRDGVGEAANCLMALLLCALGAMSGRALLSTGDKEKEDHPYAPLFILLGVLMAASSFETADGFAPGRILSMLAVLLFAFERGSAFAIPAALCIGLGMDLGAGGGSFVHAASYAFSAVLVNVTARGNRVLSALWFALSILCFALPMNAHAGLVLLYEGLAATLLFLLIPSRFLRGKRLCSSERHRQCGKCAELILVLGVVKLNEHSVDVLHRHALHIFEHRCNGFLNALHGFFYAAPEIALAVIIALFVRFKFTRRCAGGRVRRADGAVAQDDRCADGRRAAGIENFRRQNLLYFHRFHPFCFAIRFQYVQKPFFHA